MTTQTLSDFAEIIRQAKEAKRLEEAAKAAEIVRESVKIQNERTLEVHEKAVAASGLLSGLLGAMGSTSTVKVHEPELLTVPVVEQEVEIKTEPVKKIKKKKPAGPKPESNKTVVDTSPKLDEPTNEAVDPMASSAVNLLFKFTTEPVEQEIDVKQYLTADMLKEAAPAPEVTVAQLQQQLEQLRSIIDTKLRSVDAQVSQLSWGGSGGGAARVSDLDDVDVRSQELVKDNILYYEPTKRKWLPKSIEQLATDLAPLIGGQLYAPYNRMSDETPQYLYIGEAQPGTHVNQVGWRIKRIEQLPGGDMNVVWAAGSLDFSLVWDFRDTYDYSVV